MFPMATPFLLRSIFTAFKQFFILCEQSYDFEYPKKIKLRRSGLLIARGFNPGMQWRNNESAEERVGFGDLDRIEAVLRGSYFKPCSVNSPGRFSNSPSLQVKNNLSEGMPQSLFLPESIGIGNECSHLNSVGVSKL